MNQEWKSWEQQFFSNFGIKELLRFLGVFAGWQLAGFALSVLTGNVMIFFPFLLTAFAFPFVCRRWRPAYWLLRFILGNENLPPGPMPRRRFQPGAQHGSWWSHIAGFWYWAFGFTLLYLVLWYFLR